MRNELKVAWDRFTSACEAYEKAHPDRMAEAERWFREEEANAIDSDEEVDASTDDDFSTAVENYEIVESLSAIRFSNKKADSIYNAAFEAACAAMNDIAEDRGCTYEDVYEDVLAAVRKVEDYR